MNLYCNKKRCGTNNINDDKYINKYQKLHVRMFENRKLTKKNDGLKNQKETKFVSRTAL